MFVILVKMPETRSTSSDVVVNFLKGDEFAGIIQRIVEKETQVLKLEIDRLSEQVVILRESNIQLVHLLTSNNSIAECNAYDSSRNINNFVKTSHSNKERAESQTDKKDITQTKNQPPKKAYNGTVRHVESSRREIEVVNDNDVVTPTKHDGNGEWEFQRRRQRKVKPIVGNATNTSIQGVAKHVDFHVYRLDPKATRDDVISHLGSMGITNVRCERMQAKYPDEYSSFKVSIPAGKIEDFKKPEMWPEYVCINRFFQNLSKRGHTKD